MQERENFLVYAIDLRENLDRNAIDKPVMHNVSVKEVAEVIAILSVFTEPDSIFKFSDEISTCACFIKSEDLIYVLVSNA